MNFVLRLVSEKLEENIKVLEELALPLIYIFLCLTEKKQVPCAKNNSNNFLLSFCHMQAAGALSVKIGKSWKCNV